MAKHWYGYDDDDYPIGIGSMAICYLCDRPFAQVTKTVSCHCLRKNWHKHLVSLETGQALQGTDPYFRHFSCAEEAEKRYRALPWWKRLFR